MNPLLVLLARWQLRQIPGEELPDVALSLLASGVESPAVLELAGMHRPTLRDAEPIFRRALKEVHLDREITDCDAGRILARHWSEQIIRGEIPPYDGASNIWRVSYFACDEPSDLIPFIGLASQYEDSEDFRNELAADIVAAAAEYLAAESRALNPK